MTGNTAAQSSVMQGFAAATVIFALIMWACVGYLRPELANYRQMTNAALDATVSINAQINDLAARKARDDADRREFQMLEKDGFLGEQNRLNAARILERLRVQHRIAGLEYQIDAVDKVTIPGQPENTGVMSSSKISLNMRGFLDSDMRDFTTAIQRGLPGHVSHRQIEIVKLDPPANDLLALISRGGGTRPCQRNDGVTVAGRAARQRSSGDIRCRSHSQI